jgi:hypothetical protein
MILRALLVLLAGLAALVQTASAQTAQAQTARVASGEHGDFTRLVIELPAAIDWTVGRLPLGYGFAAIGSDQPAYDLSRVWDRIPRTRLLALRVDPATGALQLSLACDCHVFPFEYQPGMIVLDIKDGPAPAGSSFEAALEPGKAVEEAVVVDVPADVAAYDWRSVPTGGPADAAMPLDLPTGSISLDPLRDELLAQISRGAADGIVDMELPGTPAMNPGTEWGELPWTTIHLGEAAGVEVRPGGGAEIVTSRAECLEDADLDLAAWGRDMPPADLLSEARSALFGEFDRIEPDAALRAIQIHLYLGFGAEARGYADLLQGDGAEILPFYRSMSHLIDGETDPQTPFAAMLGCDGAAALWAALAHDQLPAGPGVNTDAILRSFLALPPHLRRHLGRALADKLLAHDDADAARVIRDAIERVSETDLAEVALLDAKADLHNGDLPAAQAHAETAVQAGADDSESLITLVETHFRTATPLDPGVALTLRTLLHEAGGRSDEPALQRALVLALALSGEVDAAFETVGDSDLAVRDLWQLLPVRADDSAFLTHAVLAVDAIMPAVEPTTADRIAARLVQLGFADAALRWLGSVTSNDPPERRQLAAEAELGSGNARAAADLLAGLENPAALDLRAQALILLGAYGPAQAALHAAGSKEAADRVLTWQHDWALVGAQGADPWASAARLVDAAAPVADAGPLGQSASLLEDSAAMRAAVAALLADVPVPQD